MRIQIRGQGEESLLSYKSTSSNPQFGKYDTLIKYTLVPSIPLSIIAILSINPSTWVLSEIHHFYIELFAVLLAAILSFYYLARAHTLNDKFSLFIGIGFLVNALIDLLHVVISYTFMDEFLFLKYFIPQTWFAGRIFLGAMFAIAIAGYPILARSSHNTNKKRYDASSLASQKQVAKEDPSQVSSSSSSQRHNEKLMEEEQEKKLPKTLLVALVILTIASAVVAISSLFIVFPGSVIDNIPLHRPYEIPPLALFVIALLYFYKHQLYKKSDVFYKGLLGSLVIDIFGQIIMSYSTTSFDTAHNVGHVLKDAAYFVNIIGLALSSIQYNAKLKEANRNLIEREELIRFQYEKLKESDKMQREFINIAAHELKTPTQAILGFSSLLKHYPERRDEVIEVIGRNAVRLQTLITNILDVTRIESQNLKLNTEIFDIYDLISVIVEDYKERIKGKKANLELVYNYKDNYKDNYNYNNDPILVEADKERIVQVISNLLSNSLQFTKEGHITVDVGLAIDDKKSREVIVTVSDTGSGIDPEIMPRLFTRFASKSFQGTGLGLYISKSIIEAHGGRIWSGNNRDGKGAQVSFTLPLKRNG